MENLLATKVFEDEFGHFLAKLFGENSKLRV